MILRQAQDDPLDTFTQRAKLWRWVSASGANLYFLRFTGEAAEGISALALMRRLEHGRRRGWGALRAQARVGETRWTTSIFPGNDASWLLPVKREVRVAEGIVEGDEVAFEVAL